MLLSGFISARRLGRFMVNKKTVFLFIAIVLGIVIAYYFFQTEEAKVRKKLYLLSELISKEGEEAALITAQRGHRIIALFNNQCRYETYTNSYSGSYNQQQIARQALAARSRFINLELKLFDISIEFPYKTRANVTLTANITGKTKIGEEIDHSHEIEVILYKVEKKWLISHIKVVEILVK